MKQRLVSFVEWAASVEVPLRVRVRDTRTTIVYWLAMCGVLGFGGGAAFTIQAPVPFHCEAPGCAGGGSTVAASSLKCKMQP